ncbi:hypothetical protein SLNWT_6963 [Streptomyces albus]|uniref:Condensation domain-containing protein n=1 Tax=Streptomyces albus (strain ATCC 21838 / DSM 41398 / FERM P-419 / JCM 4703 / NBRC 107858) TaxID=1081613 RepID=A0A0B5EZV3_STRA4|nr:hypothetical protein SLNWT_6963 [Streptomyces albus]AOU81641.1 hypothetical protein SLNHY_6950 [Streptomyces albus]AYN37332.1 hypothetical protein DUI70_6839 [Streptomyces albus]
MRMTQLLDHLPAPGEVVEFTLGATLAPRPHEVPASLFQQGHLGLARANRQAGRTQSPWVALSFELPGRADPGALAEAWLGLARRHEAYRSWYAHEEDGTLRGHLLPAEGIEVRVEKAGEFTDPRALQQHLHRRIDEVTGAPGPGLLAGAVLRPHSSTVWCAIDHAYTDGHSMALVFEEIRERYAAALRGEEPALPEAPGYLALNRAEAAYAAGLTPDSPELDTWREFFATADGGFPAFPGDLGHDSDELLPGTRLSLPVFTGTEARAFRAHCARNGGGFAAGMFAALALVQRELADEDAYRVLTAVSTRSSPRDLRIHGWLVNLVPLAFTLPGTPGLDAAVPVAQQAFQRARSRYDVPLHRAVELLAPAGQQLRIPPMASYLDGRSAPGAADYLDREVRMLTGPDNASGVSIWFNWFRDRAELVVSMPDTPQAAVSVPAVLERAVAVLRSAIGAGPLPPTADPA